MALFDTPSPPPTAEQLVASQIDDNLRQAAQTMLEAYSNVRNLVYAHPTLSPEEVYAAFAANTGTGLTPEALGNAARATKAVVNLFSPGKIVDDVPEAVLNFGA